MSNPPACTLPDRRPTGPRGAAPAIGLLLSFSLSACASWPWAEPPPPAPAKSSRVVERDLSAGAPLSPPSAAR